ncbi:MAG TPA: ABC transporter permease [Vicinamibacterales bacterium]|nr:ABC transporter permease [Vicinamibacterales bacterium]
MALRSDIRFAVRLLMTQPGFTLVVVAALAIGIGANTAIFSVVNTVLLQPLPYPEPDRLVRIGRQFPAGIGYTASVPKFMAWRRARSFDGIAAYDFGGPGLNLSGGDRPEQVRGIHVSADYFRVFGASPAMGRTFADNEDVPGGPRVAVLAHGLWVRRFGADPTVLGRAIVLNGEPFTLTGVLSERFRPEPPAEVFVPLQGDPNSTNQAHFLWVAGRLQPNVTLATAQAELKVLGDQFRRSTPEWMDSRESVAAEPMRETLVQGVRPALLILLGAVALVLLIACANVANLLLARAAVRQKEIAVRAAVGAGRADIVRQLLTETVLLSLAGAAAGLVLGVWGARTLVALSPADLPRASELTRGSLLASVLDWRLLAFTLSVSVATGILFGLAPALHLASDDHGVALKEGGGHGATSVHVARLRGALVAAEIALALVLLVGATLLIRTFANLRAVQPGFDADNVLTMQTSLAGGKYSTTEQVSILVREVTQRIDALPGTQGSAAAVTLPTEFGPDLPFRIEGRTLPAGARFHGDEQWRYVSPAYFRALGIPLVRGRFFDERDVQRSSPVVIINAALAKKYWPDGNALGQQLTIGGGLGPEFNDATRQIVGIAGDVREAGLERPAPPVVYIPQAQIPDAMTRFGNGIVPATWIVKASGNPVTLTEAVQKVFLAVDGLPTSRVRTMRQVVAQSTARHNFNMLVLTIFGAIALLLAAIGIYGVMSYSVQQGRHEIGVRIALGAGRRDILSLVVGRGMRLAALGLVAGVLGALAATRVLSRLLYGVGPTDPLTFGIVAVALAAVAFLACYVPARRATCVDPLIALRSQ